MNTAMNASASTARKAQNTNPFARALAEMEQSIPAAKSASQKTQSAPLSFAEALAAKSGKTAQNGESTSQSAQTNKLFEEQQARALELQKREALRKKLHDQVNPVHTKELFDAREKQVLHKIEQLRQELSLLSKEVAGLNKDVELTLMTEITEPGEQGSYYLSFFENLRSFIMLLRKKVKSTRTWAHTFNGKQSKKKKRGGLQIGGADHEKTSTVHDMLHHERSSQYSGM